MPGKPAFEPTATQNRSAFDAFQVLNPVDGGEPKTARSHQKLDV